ncbi:MAG: ABC transporter permease [Rikenellaceae bacterium]
MFLFVKRYLLSKKSHSVVNIITTLSLVSISLPVAAVIILLSVFNGFGELIEATNKIVDPDVMVVRAHGNLFEMDDLDISAIEGVEGVEALSFVSEQSVLLESDGRRSVVTLRGVDSAFLSVVPLDENIVTGEYATALGELDRIVLGSALASRMGARHIVNRSVELYALKQSGFSSLLPMSNYEQRTIKISALFSADMQSEERYAITSLRAVQRLTGSSGRASQLFVALSDGASQRRVMEAIEEIVGEEYSVKSRYDLNPMIYDIVTYEKWGLFFISILIMVLASFTLIGALSMLIIEKRENIATLRAMGGSWSFIHNIFFGEGVLISALGISLGALLGCGVTLAQQHWGLVKLPAQTFLVEYYPVKLLLFDVAIVVSIALAISLLLSEVVVKQMIKKE